MTIDEFYDKAVDLYQKTGQGLPYKLMLSHGQEIANELVEMGLMKLIKHRYSTLPDDEWLCLTNVICPEESMAKKDYDVLHFIRQYLGVKEDDIFISYSYNKEFQSKYKVWVEENKEELERIPNLPLFHELGVTPRTEEEKLADYSDVIEKYKTSNHYTDNKTVSWVINNCNDQLRIFKQMIPLMEDVNHDDLDETKKDRDIIVRLKELLKRFDSNKPIQECF